MQRKLRFLLFLFVVWCTAGAIAQTPRQLANPGFSLINGGSVYASARQPDGSLVLIGSFESINGVPRRGIARVRADGTVDPDWGPSYYASYGVGRARPLLVADDTGAVYVGGDIDFPDGTYRRGLFKLSADSGQLVANWQSTFSSYNLSDLAVDASGVYLVTNGDTLYKLSRDTGSVQWTVPTYFIQGMQLDGTGFLYLLGFADSVDSPAFLMRLSTQTGAVDSAWSPALSVLRSWEFGRAMAVDSCGSVYVAGYMSIGAAPPSDRIAKISTADGAVDTGWDPGAVARVKALTADAECSVYVAGDFFKIGDRRVMNLAKLARNDGSVVDAWLPEGACCGVDGLAVEASGAIRVTGDFRRIGNETRLGLAVLDTGGRFGPPIDAESRAFVHAITADPEGGVIVAGAFAKAGGTPRHGLLRLRPNGTLDTEWTLSLGSASQVSVVAARPGKTVYVGGLLDGYDKGLIRLVGTTGALDPDWNLAVGRVDAMAFANDDSIFVGGSFSSIGNVAQPYIAKLSATGEVDLNWRPSASGRVDLLSLGAGSDLYVGGEFWTFGGQRHSCMAKVDAITGAVRHEWQASFCSLNEMAFDESGLLVAGYFNGPVMKLMTTTGEADGRFVPIEKGQTMGFPSAPDGSFFAIAGGRDDHYSLQRFSLAVGAPDPAWNIPLGSLGIAPPIAVDTRGTVYTVALGDDANNPPRLVAYSADTIFFDSMDP